MNEILNIVIGSITISGIVIYLGKLLINKSFDAAIKSYENKLDLIKIEHQIKYNKLHEERALLLKELYKELYSLEKDLEHLTTIFQGPEWTSDNERTKTAIEQLNKCKDILENNRIFFPTKFCDELKSTFDDSFEIINKMEMAKRKENSRKSNLMHGLIKDYKEGESPVEIWDSLYNKVNTEIKDRRIELAESFKKMIGVEN